MEPQRIAALIDASPMNRGMVCSAWLENPRNIAIATGDNVVLFSLEAEGLCEFHWLDTPTRGRQAIDDTRAAMQQIFDTTTARLIYGLVPSSHRASRIMARWIGARFLREIQTEEGPCQIFVMTPEQLKGN